MSTDLASRSDGPFIGGLTRLVWQAVRRRIYADVIAAGFDDLNPAHVAVFRYPTADGMRPSDLAEEMQITKQSVNGLLGHLERQGYVVRQADADDNRSRRIRLTTKGRRLEETVWSAAEGAQREAAEVIGARRMRELRRSLTELAHVLAGAEPDRHDDRVEHEA